MGVRGFGFFRVGVCFLFCYIYIFFVGRFFYSCGVVWIWGVGGGFFFRIWEEVR